MSALRISQLAERSGVPASTPRFYETAGLLPVERTPSGYRRYGPDAVERLGSISSAKCRSCRRSPATTASSDKSALRRRCPMGSRPGRRRPRRYGVGVASASPGCRVHDRAGARRPGSAHPAARTGKRALATLSRALPGRTTTISTYSKESPGCRRSRRVRSRAWSTTRSRSTSAPWPWAHSSAWRRPRPDRDWNTPSTPSLGHCSS
ncbi:MerR family transcriptional regulator [Streptomyces virginiae]|uniref:MerR family transcriptional regulator n=1 Tax=Streptomyces virginiae TaxID=1961 RepID=UPI00365DCA92